MMNDLTSWDNYSDLSDEEEDLTYNCQLVNENTKKLILRKYVSYVKGAIPESELTEIMSQCQFRDEEIKKKVDEKLNSIRETKVQEWKANNKDYKDQPKSMKNVRNFNKNYQNYNNDNSHNGGSSNIGNSSSAHVNLSVNMNATPLTTNAKPNGEFGHFNNDNYGSHTNNFHANNYYSQKNVDFSQSGQGNGLSNAGKYNYSTNQNFPSNNNCSGPSISIHPNNKNFKNQNNKQKNQKNSYNKIQKPPTNKEILQKNEDEEDIDKYFSAALNFKEQGKATNTENKSLHIHTQTQNLEDNKSSYNDSQTAENNLKTQPEAENDISSSRSKTNRLSNDDIKEFVEELKKNKDLIQRRRNESFTLSSTKKAENETVEKENENVVKNEKSEDKTLFNSQDSKKENEPECEFEFSKFPAHCYINAKSYNNYFFETGNKREKFNNNYNTEPNSMSDQAKTNSTNPGYVNMNMSMNMTMNMKMFPQPGYPFNPMFMPNMAFYYPMQMGMDPRFAYNPYMNQGNYQQFYANAQNSSNPTENKSNDKGQ